MNELHGETITYVASVRDKDEATHWRQHLHTKEEEIRGVFFFHLSLAIHESFGCVCVCTCNAENR